MRLNLRFVLGAMAAAALGWTMAVAPAVAAETGQVRRLPAEVASTSGQVIVKFRSGATVLKSRVLSASGASGASATGPQAAAVLSERLGLKLTDGRALSERTQVMRASGLSSQALAQKIAADAEVEWAVVDGRRHLMSAPNDPLYPDGQTVNSLTAGQWYLRAPTSTVISSINAVGAWDTTRGSSSMVVAVLDTGIRSDHPDLSAKLLSGYDFVSDTETANDGDGRDSDPSDPGDWITSTENASGTFKDCGTEDSTWHGTQVAGIIGASTDNSSGMAGTAPGVSLLPVRVMGKCGGDDSDIIAGMRWAAGLSVSGLPTNPNPARVLNLSLGGSGSCSSAYQEAVDELVAAGVVVVVAAGNEGKAVGAPANCSGVIAVAGLRHLGTKSGFSSLGPEVAISAPGGNCVNDVLADTSLACLYSILSTTNTGTQGPVSSAYTDAFNYALGTSFSAPMVAGTAALMLSANSDLSASQVRSLLRSSARSFPTSGADAGTATCTAPTQHEQNECYCTTSTCGAGMLDASAAVLAAANLASSGTPVAAITASAVKVQPSTSVTLSGADSTASSGSSITDYQWSIVSGSSLASFSGSTTGFSVALLARSAGTVTVRLTVTDGSGGTDTADQAILILAGAPTASFTVSDTTPTAGEGVTLDGSASSATGDATIASYLWELTSGSAIASFGGSTTEATASLNFTSPGSITVRLTVTDSDGYSSSSSQTLTVSAASSGSSSSGGGAMAPWWVLALLGLGLGLLLGRPRRGQAPSPADY